MAAPAYPPTTMSPVMGCTAQALTSSQPGPVKCRVQTMPPVALNLVTHPAQPVPPRPFEFVPVWLSPAAPGIVPSVVPHTTTVLSESDTSPA